jgi:hypothetical protein
MKTELDALKGVLKDKYNGAKKDWRMPSQDFKIIGNKSFY